RRPETATEAPCRESSRARAAPRPVPPPVIQTTWSSKRFMHCRLPACAADDNALDVTFAQGLVSGRRRRASFTAPATASSLLGNALEGGLHLQLEGLELRRQRLELVLAQRVAADGEDLALLHLDVLLDRLFEQRQLLVELLAAAAGGV